MKVVTGKILKDVINCTCERCNYHCYFQKESHHLHQIKLPLSPANKPEICLLCNRIQLSFLKNQDHTVTLSLRESGIISSQIRSCSLLVIKIITRSKIWEKDPTFTQIRAKERGGGRSTCQAHDAHTTPPYKPCRGDASVPAVYPRKWGCAEAKLIAWASVPLYMNLNSPIFKV